MGTGPPRLPEFQRVSCPIARPAPDGSRPWLREEPSSPTPTRGSVGSGSSPDLFCSHHWPVSNLPHRPFLPARSGSTRRAGLSCAKDLARLPTPPGAPHLHETPRPVQVIYMPRPASSFSHKVLPDLLDRRLICMPHPSPPGLRLVSAKTSGLESLPFPYRPGWLVIAAVAHFSNVYLVPVPEKLESKTAHQLRTSASCQVQALHAAATKKESCATRLFQMN